MSASSRGAPKVTHNAVETGSAVLYDCGDYNALVVHHLMENPTSGGYVSLKMSPTGATGTYIAHHGDGTNIKTQASASSYASIFKGIMKYVEVTLNRTDGKHTVTIQPINV